MLAESASLLRFAIALGAEPPTPTVRLVAEPAWALLRSVLVLCVCLVAGSLGVARASFLPVVMSVVDICGGFFGQFLDMGSLDWGCVAAGSRVCRDVARW